MTARTAVGTVGVAGGGEVWLGWGMRMMTRLMLIVWL